MVQAARSLKVGELLAILGEIYQGKETGTLVLQRGEVSKFLYAQEGQIIFAASNAPEDKFTQILLDKGKLSEEQLALATEKKEGRTIGRTLVELGFLASEDLLDALVEQMRRVASSAAAWESGTSVFKPGVLPPNLARLPVSTPRFIVDTALSIPSREWVSQGLGQLSSALLMSPAEREAAAVILPTPAELHILEQVDGRRSAREVCDAANVDLFTGARFLMGLTCLGLLHIQPAMAPTPKGPSPVETMDLSFLESMDEGAFVEPPKEPVKKPVHPPAQPAEGKARLSQPLPFEPSPPPAEPAPRQEEPLAVPAPPAEMEPQAATDWAVPPLQSAGKATPPPSMDPLIFAAAPKRRRSRRWPWIAAAVVLLLLAGASAWYYFVSSGAEYVPMQPEVSPAKARRPQPPTPPPSSLSRTAVPAPGGSSGPSSAKIPVAAPAKQTASAPIPSKTTGAAPRMTPQAQSPNAAPVVPAAPSPPLKPNPPAEKTALPVSSPAGLQQARNLLEEGRYPEAAQAFRRALGAVQGGYTIQVEVACQPETIQKGLAAAGSSDNYRILPYDLHGRSCYQVIWGHYADRESADAALKAMPSFFLQASSPRVAPWDEAKASR
jgi:septal ring-binding cell division protein DamX